MGTVTAICGSRQSGIRASRPSFSIVIPTYQRRDTVCETVRSLARVSYDGEFEVIVVIDGSTDGTASSLAQIDCPFPLRPIEQPNQGASEARNRGAAAARYEIILFLDDDMICDPALLSEHARSHKDGADAVIGDTPIDPGSPPGFLAESVARWIETTRVRSPLSPFDIFTGQLSVRRSVFRQLGGFDAGFTNETAFGNEDADFGTKLLARYDVRHNPAAISRQVYVVSPREYMDRARRAVAADLHFISKHPELASELFEAKGINRPLVKWLYLPLSRIPFLPAPLARTAVFLADAALKTRFRSNRLVARYFSGARSVAYWSALRASGWYPFSTKVLVLCYHAIEDQSDDPILAEFGVPPKLFADQLDSLTRRRFTFVTPSQLAAFIQSNAPLPSRPVLLTFDDGYADLLGLARDLLRPRGIEALAFVVSGFLSKTNEWDGPYGAKQVRLLSADGLKEVSRLGIEIGSHSRTHGEMPLMTDAEREADASLSADDLVTAGLPQPRFFAYPYGYVDGPSKAAVEKAGYLAAFGLIQSRAGRKSDPLDLPRVIILSRDSGWRFWLKTTIPATFNWFVVARRLVMAAIQRVIA